MIIHFLLQEKFTDQFIDFVDANFDIADHLFFIYDKAFYKINSFGKPNVYYEENVGDYFRKYHRELSECSQIIVHGLFCLKLMICLLYHRKYYPKLNLCFWGGDLYAYRDIPHGSITAYTKWRIKEHYKRLLIPKAAYFATIVNGDEEIARKIYKAKGKKYTVSYFDNNISNILQEIENKPERHEGINIQIGNSATESNHHIESLEILKKFSNEDIHIYVPLSYGDDAYKRKVIEKGKDIFGNKFIPILNFMEKNEYYSFLNTIDVALFNNDRQQALGNIWVLLYLGTKVFMRKDTSMGNVFFENSEFTAFDIKQIGKFGSIKELVYLDDYSKEKNRKIFQEGKAIAYENWKIIFGLNTKNKQEH